MWEVEELIYYRCKICGCIFAIKKSDVEYAEYNRIYLTCPVNGRHDKLELIKELMEERSAVNI